MSMIDKLKEERRQYLGQLRTAKEICEENVSWLTKENNNATLTLRLIDLTPILAKPYPTLEEFGPIEEAIGYAAGGTDMVMEFIDCATMDDGFEGEQSLSSDTTAIHDALFECMCELRSDLEEIPGFVGDDHHPSSPFSYYFLGVTSQGKGAIAVVDERIKEPTDLHLQQEMLF